jgi:hypothetical protein
MDRRVEVAVIEEVLPARVVTAEAWADPPGAWLLPWR